MFIAIEVVDSSGKATQAKALTDRLVRVGRKVHSFSFPRYETPVGKIILDLLKGELSVGCAHTIASSDHNVDGTETFSKRPDAEAQILQTLMTADKLDAAVEIDRVQRRGEDVVADRWTPSAECYGAADGLGVGWIRRIQESLPEPDFYFYIVVPEEEALRRRPKLRDRYELDRNKQAAVRRNYSTLWGDHAHEVFPHWISIDGLGTPDEVTQRIWDAIVARRNI